MAQSSSQTSGPTTGTHRLAICGAMPGIHARACRYRVQAILPSGECKPVCTELQRPCGVAVDKDCDILASEFLAHRVWALQGWR
eukprot:3591197-Rhodomonas_salina.2